MAFIPIILLLVKGAAIGPILASLSLVQWIDIAGALLNAAPAARRELIALHDVFYTLNAMAAKQMAAQDMANEAVMFFASRPEAGPDRTQEDVNQDARIDDLEKRVDQHDEEISHLIKWISDLEKAQGQWKSS